MSKRYTHTSHASLDLQKPLTTLETQLQLIQGITVTFRCASWQAVTIMLSIATARSLPSHRKWVRLTYTHYEFY